MASTEFKTLGQRLSEGRLPVGDALRYAMMLAESLRRIHDSGKVHGAVTPINLSITPAGLDLLPAPEWTLGAITPYTAPEVLHGRESDCRSDIFSFGAVLFEMLTGRRAFEGETRVALVSNITHAPTPSSGSPAVDRLLGPCLTKNPEERTPRMQKVIMELKLLQVAARRTEPSAAGSGFRRDPLDSGSLRTEMQQLEGRIATRFQAHERAVIDLQRSLDDAVGSLKIQLSAMTAEFAAAKTRVGSSIGGGTLDGASNERVHTVERRVEEMRLHFAQFERDIAADLVDIESNLKVHEVAIESSRTAMAQTDDLVERVVEALESLQSAVMDRSESMPERSAFVVN
jgi:eukaryotic-like serine/threonine-protein kinase